MMGIFVGAIIFGRISDIFGRKITVTLTLIVSAAAQLAAGFTQSYATYTLTRFLSGIGRFRSAFTLNFS